MLARAYVHRVMWINTVPVAEEPEIFGFLCGHLDTLVQSKLYRSWILEVAAQRPNIVNPMAQEWRIQIAGPMDPLEVRRS
jgi:hypothetical protein